MYELAGAGPAVAYCGLDNLTFTATAAQATCPICGQPPSHALPLAPLGDGPFGVGAEIALPLADDVDPVPFRANCPTCKTPFDLIITPDRLEIVPADDSREVVLVDDAPGVNEGARVAEPEASSANPDDDQQPDPPASAEALRRLADTSADDAGQPRSEAPTETAHVLGDGEEERTEAPDPAVAPS
jgi:hypothetical protein